MVRIRNRLKTSEKEKLNAEISFLKAQINPHFLFNSLNGIYALALLNSTDTAPAIVKLSNMMRYVLTEASAELVSLQKEIEYLKNYIELQQVRFGDSLKLTFTKQGDAHGKSIAPMLVIPLIENAFKYGVSPEEPSFIKIDISITGNTVHFNIENKKVNIHLVEKTGVGLKNTRMRLDLLYANRYSFNIQETEAQYTVSLTLQV
jgi:sensor histidine kinase YesM